MLWLFRIPAVSLPGVWQFEFHSHAQNVRALHQSEAVLLWCATCSSKHGVYICSMYNVSCWTVCGSKEAVEVLKNSRIWRTKYRAIQRSKRAIPAFFLPMFTSSDSICHIYGSVWPEKLSLDLVLGSLRSAYMIMKGVLGGLYTVGEGDIIYRLKHWHSKLQ